MRNLTFIVILLLIGIAGVGYYRGWFALSTNNTDQTPSATITVDKNKFHEDEQKARDKVQGAGQKAKDEVGDLTGKSKEPQRQP
jgi:hypothetical protein